MKKWVIFQIFNDEVLYIIFSSITTFTRLLTQTIQLLEILPGLANYSIGKDSTILGQGTRICLLLVMWSMTNWVESNQSQPAAAFDFMWESWWRWAWIQGIGGAATTLTLFIHT